MIRRPPRSTRTDTLFPYTTLCRSRAVAAVVHRRAHVTRAVLLPVRTDRDGVGATGWRLPRVRNADHAGHCHLADAGEARLADRLSDRRGRLRSRPVAVGAVRSAGRAVHRLRAGASGGWQGVG